MQRHHKTAVPAIPDERFCHYLPICLHSRGVEESCNHPTLLKREVSNTSKEDWERSRKGRRERERHLKWFVDKGDKNDSLHPLHFCLATSHKAT